MDASFSDFSSSIRYTLTSRPALDGDVEIVLDLFRGSTPALNRTIASVRPGKASSLLDRCRRHLEHHGVHAVTHAPSEPEPGWTASAAAFDWVFTG